MINAEDAETAEILKKEDMERKGGDSASSAISALSHGGGAEGTRRARTASGFVESAPM